MFSNLRIVMITRNILTPYSPLHPPSPWTAILGIDGLMWGCGCARRCHPRVGVATVRIVPWEHQSHPSPLVLPRVLSSLGYSPHQGLPTLLPSISVAQARLQPWETIPSDFPPLPSTPVPAPQSVSACRPPAPYPPPSTTPRDSCHRSHHFSCPRRRCSHGKPSHPVSRPSRPLPLLLPNRYSPAALLPLIHPHL